MKNIYLKSLVYNLLQSRIKKIIVLLIMLAALVSSVMLVTTELVKVKLLPKPLADTFTLYVDLPEGKSVYETKEVTSCILNSLKNEDIITDMSVFLGESAPTDFSSMIKGRLFDNRENIANIVVNLKKDSMRDESSISAVHRLRPIIQNSCTLHNAKIKMIDLPAGPPVIASVVLEITSDTNLTSMKKLAYQLEDIFKTTKGLVDIDVISDSTYAKYVIHLNNNKILNSNLQLEQVKNILYLSFEGMDIAYTTDWDVQNQIPIHLTLNKKTKIFNSNNKESLIQKFSEIKLMNTQGLLVPLSELISISQIKNGHKIISKNLSPIVSVVGESDLESQIYSLLSIREDIVKKLSKQYEVKKTTFLDLTLTNRQTNENFYIEWDGEQKLSVDTIVDLSTALGVAIVLIFFMMVVYYKSFSLAAAIVLASFISVVGVIYIHFILDIFVSETFYMTGTSLIGFIALIGINSRNSLLIIDFAKQLIEENQLSVQRAIAVSIQIRAKPILLTVISTILASALLSTDPVFGGLGVALIGGTIASFAVSLFIVPIIIQKPLLKQYPIQKEIDEER